MTDKQFAVIVGLLTEIRNGLQILFTEPEPIVADGCEHPEDARIDMSTLGDLNHWICKLCRFDNKATPMN